MKKFNLTGLTFATPQCQVWLGHHHFSLGRLTAIIFHLSPYKTFSYATSTPTHLHPPLVFISFEDLSNFEQEAFLQGVVFAQHHHDHLSDPSLGLENPRDKSHLTSRTYIKPFPRPFLPLYGHLLFSFSVL